jgi:hypothetical protein
MLVAFPPLTSKFFIWSEERAPVPPRAPAVQAPARPSTGASALMHTLRVAPDN